MMRARCRVHGCLNASSVYGVCKEHEAEAIRKRFMLAVDHGLCTQEPPPCFGGADDWREYVVAFMLCRSDSERRATPIEFCRDCTPRFKDEMTECGRCSHQETVFIRSDKHGGDVIGVPAGKKSTSAWESAVMGVSGEVVKLPPPEQIDKMLRQIAIDNAPKKRGPKFKRERLSS